MAGATTAIVVGLGDRLSALALLAALAGTTVVAAGVETVRGIGSPPTDPVSGTVADPGR